jgi:hypothetical protein
LKNPGNLRNHLLKSLPAVGRCEIKRAFSSFPELSQKKGLIGVMVVLIIAAGIHFMVGTVQISFHNVSLLGTIHT